MDQGHRARADRLSRTDERLDGRYWRSPGILHAARAPGGCAGDHPLFTFTARRRVLHLASRGGMGDQCVTIAEELIPMRGSSARERRDARPHPDGAARASLGGRSSTRAFGGATRRAGPRISCARTASYQPPQREIFKLAMDRTTRPSTRARGQEMRWWPRGARAGGRQRRGIGEVNRVRGQRCKGVL